MFFLIRGSRCNILRVHQKVNISYGWNSWLHSLPEIDSEIERITRIINDHPYPERPLKPTLIREIPSSVQSTTYVENVLGRLFATHSNGLKAYEFFKFSLSRFKSPPSSDAFEKTLHILTRMRYFDKAWKLMKKMKKKHPSLITLKSMSIMLSKIAKFQSYEDTIEAFEKMEKDIFSEKKFGTEEFNILLRAFCTQREMKEARSVLNNFHSRFPPDAKTMNILLLGFKESGDVISVELFYHEILRRGFKPNNVTFNIRIDTYCKRRCFGDALRVYNEMEGANCLPTIETITTLIHGAGMARNIGKAKELFCEISKRGLEPDIGVYNAFVSSLIRCRDVKSAATMMDEMEEKNIGLDDVTYHTMFMGLMRSKATDGVFELYEKMIKKNFVPKTRTIVMLMKFFFEKSRVDLGLNLWSYLMEKGHCPPSHALDLLVTGLCSRGRVQEAFECSKQILERGRYMSELVFRMLDRYLTEEGELEKLRNLEDMMKRLQKVLPPPKGFASESR